MFALLKTFIGIAILCVIAGFVRTYQMEHGDNQVRFEKGTAQGVHPDGVYKGSVGRDVSWLGKKFNPTDSRGINIFKTSVGEEERYPFKTSYSSGVHDTGLTVIKIDYNVPQNPWWLRPVLDEIVQTGPDEFLGKLHLRLIPGYPFTLAYFELRK